MRIFDSGKRWVRAVWLSALVLLALPNCMNDFGKFECHDPNGCDDGCDPTNPESSCFNPCLDPENPDCPGNDVPEFEPGSPATSAIMCYIPAPVAVGASDCATQADVDDLSNISLTAAATALAEGRSSFVALDFSATTCPGGLPKKITFLGEAQFPDGLTLCINCGTQIPTKYATTTEACKVKCRDLINFDETGDVAMPAEGADAFCEANAHTSPNYNNKDTCDPRFDHACTSGGNQDMTFPDPRRTPEPVMWIDGSGTDDGGGTNSLTRNQATSVPADFDAGAASLQTIASGDGWVDFSALETNLSHVLGVRESCDDPVNTCQDTDPGLDDIRFAISLNSDGQVFIIESGSPLTVLGPFGTYAIGERFRVKFVDNHDGTATISYVRIVGNCPDGTQCTEDPVTTPSTVKPAYPLRVDATFREQNATLSNVTLVRIQQ